MNYLWFCILTTSIKLILENALIVNELHVTVLIAEVETVHCHHNSASLINSSFGHKLANCYSFEKNSSNEFKKVLVRENSKNGGRREQLR